MADNSTQGTSPCYNEYPVLQEYPLETHLLELIPARGQKALSTFDIDFTCVDADGHYIAIGSSVGIVYLLDRRKTKLFKLRNDHKDAITCVKVLMSLECLVVFGSKNGAVFVFKVPFEGKDEELEKFTVEGLHTTSITSLEWARNGMKFFSGDENGVVVCTEIDHFEHQSRSSVILNQQSKIVQLSYNRMHLVVSTYFQSVVYSCENNSIVRIGQKERKCFGPFGAIIINSDITDEVIYASRPGQRLWKSDKSGIIHETVIFKSALSQNHPVIQLNGSPKTCEYSDFQFGQISMFNDKYILTSSDNTILLIDPEQRCVVASSPSLFPIVDVTTANDEIFILRGLRQVIRISSFPDPYTSKAVPEETSIIEDILVPFKELGTFVKERSDTFTAQTENSALFEWLRKKRSTSSPADVFTDDSYKNQNKLQGSEPLPELVKIDSTDCTPVILDNITIPQIPILEITPARDNESDEIVYKPKKKNKHKKVRFRSKSPNERKPLEPNSKDIEVDSISNKTEDSENKTKSSGDSSTVVSNLNGKSDQIVTDENAISNSVVIVNSGDFENSVKNKSIDSTSNFSLGTEEILSDLPIINTLENYLNLENVKLGANITISQELNISGAVIETNADNNFENNVEVDDIYASFDSSKTVHIETELNMSSEVDSSNEESSVISIEEIESPKYGVDWVEYRAPEVLMDFCVSNVHIFCVDIKNQLYYSNYPILGLQWKFLNQPAEKVSVSPAESIIWVLYKGTVFAAVQKSPVLWFDIEWLSFARNIVSIAVEDDCGWYVTSTGTLVMQTDLKPFRPYGYPKPIFCEFTILQVACRNGLVWVLSADGSLYSFNRKSKSTSKFEKIQLDEITDIDSIYLGVHQTGWIIDSSGIIKFLIGVTPDSPGGIGKPWEVELSKYFLSSTSHLQRAVQMAMHNETLTSLIRGKQHICLSTSISGVWFSKTLDNLVYSNKRHIIGHAWDLYLPHGSAVSTKWKYISACGISGSQGSVWCLNSTSELFCVSPSTKVPITVELPSVRGICSVVPSIDALWLLTVNGEIYFRRGITATCSDGIRWEALDLTQLRDQKITFISCSPEATWACTNNGTVLLRLGSLSPSSSRSLPQAWIPIAPNAEEMISPILNRLPAFGRLPLPLIQSSQEARFCKIYVGPLGYPVWVIDDRDNVYVRNRVSLSFPMGEKWLPVPELQAKELAISKNAVWLLDHSGNIYRRFGVSEKNPCGDYWKQMPGNLDSLAVTTDDDLWGLKNESIFLHSSFVLNFTANEDKISPPVRGISEDDWEDIMADVDNEL